MKLSSEEVAAWDELDAQRDADLGERRKREQAERRAREQQREPTSWAPIDIGPYTSGEFEMPPPEILCRTDGKALFYPGRVHSFSGESESGKTWVVLAAVAEVLRRGDYVVYCDFEDTPASVVGRLLALGVDPTALLTRFSYIQPEGPLGEREAWDLHVACIAAQFVVFDGVTEALALHGYDPNSNADIAAWLNDVPRRPAREGAAVVLIDHVVKDKEARGRFAIGAQHKLSGVDAAYGVKVIEPFGRGRNGKLKVTVHKDRPGYVRGFARDGCVALVNLESREDGSVAVALRPPDAAGEAGGAFRPTFLMARVAAAVAATPGMTKNAIRGTVKGKTSAVDLALELLVTEGFIVVEREGQSHRHRLVKPFEEDHDPRDPTATQPRPVAVPSDRDPATRLTTVAVAGHGGEVAHDRDPDPDAELARLAEKGLA